MVSPAAGAAGPSSGYPFPTCRREIPAKSRSMPRESADVVVVGAGACGSLVAKELSEAGLSVVVLEAGKRFDPTNGLSNSEENAVRILWSEPRVFSGDDAVAPKTGVGVGGGTLAWLGVVPRFHPDDFMTHTAEG